MGHLPAARVTAAPFFVIVGVDFARPITIRDGKVQKPTKFKACIYVFVCFATKATHLEPVSYLSTKAFVAALRRFVACCGFQMIIVTVGLILWEPVVLYRKFMNSLASGVL